MSKTFEWGQTYTADDSTFDEVLMHLIRKYEATRENSARSMHSLSAQLSDGAAEVREDVMRQAPSEHQILYPLLNEAKREAMADVINILINTRDQIKAEGN